ncbi:MAG: family 10 glycosylhydrolase [Clostridiales bacterium]|jgi:uncharacterized lipoprotein YddW (UPF0748 family)|nr:family 10 glycosylhydrolase [Clostridiales bacterium]
MNKKIFLALLLILCLACFGCTSRFEQNNQKPPYNDDIADNGNGVDNIVEDNESEGIEDNKNGEMDNGTDSETDYNTDDITPMPIPTIPNFKIKGAWISSVYNIDYPSSATQNSSVLKQDLVTIVQKAKKANINTLFFQVRPCSDSLYKSSFFPWSKFLTGKLGVEPQDNFDPLQCIISLCHSSDLYLHAWINPYRLSVNDTLDSSHPMNNYQEVILNVNDRLYLNPGIPKSSQIILDGVREIATNYAIDGIHYDDYFYPEDITTQDDFAYKMYGKSFNNKADFRRSCTDNLIKSTRNLIKQINPNLQFGVSPSGIWANKKNNPLGSNTLGFESYYAIYADSRLWAKENYVDYIIPQIYWYSGQPGSDFDTILDWWVDVCKDSNTKLYIGIAGYKADTSDAWQGTKELDYQLKKSLTNADGYVIFSFKDVNKIQ